MSLYAIVKYHKQELVYKDGNGRAALVKEISKYFILCSMTVTLLDEKKDTQKTHTILLSECHLREQCFVFYGTLKHNTWVVRHHSWLDGSCLPWKKYSLLTTDLRLSPLPTTSIKVSRHLPNVRGFTGQYIMPVLAFFQQ